MPNQPETSTPIPTTAQSSQAEREARILNLRTLPSFLYCPDCGAIHYGNDMHFRADVSGIVYGSAWMSDSGINTESNDEDTQYSDYQYYCDSDDYNVTSAVEQTNEYRSRIADLASSININLNNFSNVSRLSTGRSPRTFEFHKLDSWGVFIRYIEYTGQNTLSYEMINPLLVSIAQDLALEDNENEFNYLHPKYAEMIANYNQLVEEIAATTSIATEAAPTGNTRFVATFDMGQPISINRYAEASTNRIRQEQIDPGERDPLSSNVHMLSNHRRWRDNDLSNICTCQHCAYSFECDNDIDLVICPKCNKETSNAQENHNEVN